MSGAPEVFSGQAEEGGKEVWKQGSREARKRGRNAIALRFPRSPRLASLGGLAPFDFAQGEPFDYTQGKQGQLRMGRDAPRLRSGSTSWSDVERQGSKELANYCLVKRMPFYFEMGRAWLVLEARGRTEPRRQIRPKLRREGTPLPPSYVSAHSKRVSNCPSVSVETARL